MMESLVKALGEPGVLPAVNSMLTVVAAVFSVRWWQDAAEASRTQRIPLSPNDNASAERSFLGLLRRAQHEVMMYDDGDLGDGSIYQSPTVVASVKEKLRAHPAFVMRCMLTERNGDTLFERELQDEDRVTVYARRGGRSLEHYKLFDDKVAYVSYHQRGQTARRRFYLDCRRSAPRRGKHPIALRRYIRDFEAHAVA